MIAHVYKPRRKNKNGKSVPARLYRGRYHFSVPEVALGTGDKQVAQKKLREIISEKERERAGLIAPKAERVAAQKYLADHLKDFLADLKRLDRSQDYQDRGARASRRF